jgi:hypothetical protein
MKTKIYNDKNNIFLFFVYFATHISLDNHICEYIIAYSGDYNDTTTMKLR